MSMMRNTAENVKSLITPMQTLNTELSTALKTLKDIKAVGAQAIQGISSVAKAGGQMSLGQGSNMGLGTNSARFTDTRMPGASGAVPFRYSIPGSMMYAGAQVGLGVLGAAYGAMPDLGTTVSRAAGFYGSAVRGPGTTRAGIAQATFSALAGGITGVGEDAAAAAQLVQGYYYRPGSAAFTQTMREVGGAARYLNMDNVTAARALGGMQTGAMGANLYQYGISQIDSQGNPRTFEDIAKQIFQRSYAHMGGKADYKTVQGDLQYGFLGATIKNMGFSGEQQELLSQAFLDFSQGKGFNLAGKGYGENPLASAMRMTTSETRLTERATEPMIRGFETAAGIVERLNKAMEGLPDAFFSLKATIQGITSSNVGAGIPGMSAGVLAAASGLTGAAAMRALARGGPGGGPGGGGVKPPATGVSGLLGKLGKGVPILGTLLSGFFGYQTGQTSEGINFGDVFKTAGISAATAGALAAPTGPGALLAALIAGVTAGGANLVGQVVGQNSKKMPTGGGGMGFHAAFGARGGDNSASAQIYSSPIPGAAVTTAYGIKGSMWKMRGYHTGQDYAQPEGTPIRAVAAGVVYDDGPGAAYGEYVQIDHGEYQTLYGHMRRGSKRVRVGQSVEAGQVIGEVGDTGNTTGPHLHFEVRKGKGNPVNPTDFLKNGKALGQDALSAIDAKTGVTARGMSLAPNLTLSSSIGQDFVLSQLVGNVGFSVNGNINIPKSSTGTNTVQSAAATGGNSYGLRSQVSTAPQAVGGNRTVNVTLQISQATEQEAQNFARKVKKYLEEDDSIRLMGSY